MVSWHDSEKRWTIQRKSWARADVNLTSFRFFFRFFFSEDIFPPKMALDSVVSLLFERLGHRDLLVLRGTNGEFRAVASDDHAWADPLRRMVQHFAAGEDELKSPVYPVRAHGERRDAISFFPHAAERVELAGFVLPPIWQHKIRFTSDGILEDMLHPESEIERNGIWPSRSEVFKARPLPLRCELCDVECDSYASFTEHCITFKHKVLLDPSKKFDPRFEDPRFQDPRHGGDFYAVLPTMAKFEAMHRYREAMVAWFRKPMDAAGRASMDWYAEMAYNRMRDIAPRLGLSTLELEFVQIGCNPERVAEICVEEFVVRDFLDNGLAGGHALDFVKNGWRKWSTTVCGPVHIRGLFRCITGCDYTLH